MDISIFFILAIVSYVLAFVFLVIAGLVWYRFNIHKVIGDLTGRSAKKALEKRREENENSGVKSYHTSPAVKQRGKITTLIDDSNKKQDDQFEKKYPNAEKTDVLDNSASVEQEDDKTTLLSDSVDDEQTTILGEQTTVLDDGTTVLNEDYLIDKANYRAVAFKMLQNIVLIHTSEEIQ